MKDAKNKAIERKRIGYVGSFTNHQIKSAKKSYKKSMKEPFNEQKASQYDTWENYLPGMAHHKK